MTQTHVKTEESESRVDETVVEMEIKHFKGFQEISLE